MHCLCTTTSFSVLSWAWPMVPWPGGVEQDFLELPSMALEKFASDPSLLSKVACHYTVCPTSSTSPSSALSSTEPKPVLGHETIEKIKKLDRWMVGTSQSRYFAMALFDLLVHSQAPPYSYGTYACSENSTLMRGPCHSHRTHSLVTHHKFKLPFLYRWKGKFVR